MAYTLRAEVKIRFIPAGLHDFELEYPELEIEFDYVPGQRAYTPRGEYGPIDPPCAPEVSFRSAALIDGKGLTPTVQQIQEWGQAWLDSDDGYRIACDEAEEARYWARYPNV